MAQLPQLNSDARSLDEVPNAPARDEPIGFILRLAKALHTYGVPAYELETILTACAAKLGFGVQCLSLPTSITLTLMKDDDDVKTYVIRVAPGEVHLEKLRQVSEIAHGVMDGTISSAAGAKALAAVRKAKPSYPEWLVVIAFMLVSTCVCRLFGGGLHELVGASAAGLALGLLTVISMRFTLLGHVLPATAALVSTLVAYFVAQFYPTTEVYISTVSGLIVLLPGLTLTIAMAELATQNLMSGTARLFGAGTVFILMAFGTVIGRHLASIGHWPDNLQAAEIIPLAPWTEWLSVVLASAALVILFQARLRDGHWVIIGGVIAFAAAKYASIHFNSAMTAFLGAIAVGTSANIVSRLTNIPGAMMVMPGFIILVPGAVGFKSLTALLEHDVVRGLDAAFDASLVGISLVAGLLISSLVTLPKASPVADILDK
ncbi:MAG: threonine/serine exporter family protein [Kangiellaceae bacterium]|jgi:uncharacterized membrane protein YjjP (DUF1212 family)|nr:threonine/serine exporter family protein [Kangiellaceae bacterium]